ncbi:MAG: hypothetical protein AAGA85_02445 [Bacteroidota bacterium]
MKEKLDLRVLLILAIAIVFISCSDDEGPVIPDPNALETWLGSYQIDTIGAEPIDCGIEFLQGEIITIQGDETFDIESTCTGATLADGTYEFSDGIFLLYISFRITEPDIPEFELQIFNAPGDRVRMYRCAFGTGNCTIRKGDRLRTQ